MLLQNGLVSKENGNLIITLLTKVCLVKAMFFPIVMYGWELDYKESWAPKNWCFWTVVLEKTLESSLACKGSNQSILKEISPDIHWKDWCWSWSPSTLATWWEELTHWKRPWCCERLKAGEEGDDRMRWLDGYEFKQALGVDDRQGSLMCCSPWGRKELSTTKWLNWTESWIEFIGLLS